MSYPRRYGIATHPLFAKLPEDARRHDYNWIGTLRELRRFIVPAFCIGNNNDTCWSSILLWHRINLKTAVEQKHKICKACIL